MDLNTISNQGNWSVIANNLNENFMKLRIGIEGLTGVSGSNFLGIFPSVPSKPASPAWCLVGTDMSALTMYTYSQGATAWKVFSGSTYNFTDFTGLKQDMVIAGDVITDITTIL